MHLQAMPVNFPHVLKFWQVTREFYGIGELTGITRCTDRTNMCIKSFGGPNAEIFRNCKGYFTINVQVSTDVLDTVPAILAYARFLPQCTSTLLAGYLRVRNHHLSQALQQWIRFI